MAGYLKTGLLLIGAIIAVSFAVAVYEFRQDSRHWRNSYPVECPQGFTYGAIPPGCPKP